MTSPKSTAKSHHSAGISLQQSKAMQTQADYESCATRLKALADPDRLWIVNTLMKGAKSVSALASESGMPIDKISHHLGVLRAAQLVETRREGKFIFYSLPPEIACVVEDDRIKTIDLGCCQLDLVQPKLPPKTAAEKSKRDRRRTS